MAAYKTKKVSHALLSNLEKGNTDFTYLNDFDDTAWTHPEGLRPEISSRKVSYPIPGDSKGLSNDSGDDPFRIPVSGTGLPEVNLKNVMGGIYAILTGRSKDPSALPKQPSSNVLFLGSKENGDTFVHPSVYLPSAPPLLEPNRFNYRAYKEFGGELVDFIIVLHDFNAVKTFCSRVHFSLGAGCSAAAGPIGRVAEADLRAGEKGSGMCYTYSCSKGAFVGVSLEGNVVATRMDTNLRFYGDPYLTATDILLGTVDRPKAADPLYGALRELQLKMLRRYY